MTDLTKEILEHYQVRKTKKQKSAFIDFALKKSEEMGYEARVEKGGMGVRNIVVGDPDKARLVCTAHYDTCAKLPFPNFLTPKSMLIYILYNILVIGGLVVASIALGIAVGVGIGLLVDIDIGTRIGQSVALPFYWGFLIMMIAGPANKHTVNDNTSGVTLLFDLMAKLPNEKRSEVAFVFFDLEEAGLVGSSAFAKAHKTVRDHTLLLNFDCVSDGENLLLVAKKITDEHFSLLERAFASDSRMHAEITKKGLYPSDQSKFRHGVGVAAFKKTRRGLLYMNRIHTAKDTVYREENALFIVDSTLKVIDDL